MYAMFWFLLAAPAMAFTVSNMEMKSPDGSLEQDWARELFKRTVEEELQKAFGDMPAPELPEGHSQHLDVRMEMNTDTGEEELNVVLVHTHPDGTVTREPIKIDE